MNGIQNFAQFLDNNWTSIVIVIGLIIGIMDDVRNYLSKSDDEKIEIAKSQIRETMLKMVANAELDYSYLNKSGDIKRSQIIDDIFKKYPILSKATDQQKIIRWIDDEIKKSLESLNKVITESGKE